MHRKNTGPNAGKPSASASDSIDELLLRPLQALSLELYFGGGSGQASGNFVSASNGSDEQWRRSTVVVKRVAELVQGFGRRKFNNNPVDVARQRDAWKQVLKFLFLLRAIGPESMPNDNQVQASSAKAGASPGGKSAERSKEVSCVEE